MCLLMSIGDAVGVIYVEANKLDEFKAKKTSGDDFTLVVDDSFQYGQNKEQTKRFLVFHDKEHKPYQVSDRLLILEVLQLTRRSTATSRTP